MRLGIFDRLVDRVDRDCGIKIDRNSLRRSRAGWWQKALGAHLWYGLTASDGIHIPNQIGSIFTATELIKAKKITVDGECCGIGLEVWLDEK